MEADELVKPPFICRKLPTILQLALEVHDPTLGIAVHPAEVENLVAFTVPLTSSAAPGDVVPIPT